MPPELKSMAFKLFAQFFEIVDFAVIADQKATAGGGHGLVPFAREILDGKTPVPQCHPSFGIGPNSGVIRSTMDKGISHATRDGLHPFLRRKTMGVEKSADPAHSEGSSIKMKKFRIQ
jgi:hypothetical protein